MGQEIQTERTIIPPQFVGDDLASVYAQRDHGCRERDDESHYHNGNPS